MRHLSISFRAMLAVTLLEFSCAFSEGASILIVPQQSGTVSAVDTASGSVASIATVPDHAWTDGFAVDSANDFAYHHGPSGTYRVDLSAGSFSVLGVSSSLFGSGGYGVNSGGFLVVPRQNGEINIVDPITGAVDTVATLPDHAWTDGFAVDSANDFAYHHGPSGTYRVDLSAGSFSVLGVSSSLFGSGGYGVNSGGFLVVPRQNGEINIVDPITGAVDTVATLPDHAWTDGFAVDSANDFAYHHGPSGTYRVDLSTGSFSVLGVSSSLFGSGGYGVIPEPESVLLLVFGIGLSFTGRRR